MRLNNRTLTNPFIYQGYENPKYFCDREVETKNWYIENPKAISSTTASWTCGLKDFDIQKSSFPTINLGKLL